MNFSKTILYGAVSLFTFASVLHAEGTMKGPIVRHEQPNPGLDVRVNVVPMIKHPKASHYTVTSLPRHGALYYDNVKIDEPGFTLIDPNKVTVDPENGNVTVVFSYTSTDADGHVSEPRNIILRFTDVTLSGSVLHDFNGNAKVDGEKLSNLGGEPLFVTLINAKGEVLSSKAVSKEGDYAFNNSDGVQPYKNYALVISTKKNALSAELPEKWAPSGENINSLKKGKDKHRDGTVVVKVKDKDIAEIDFGLDVRPLALDKVTAIQLNPGGKVQVPVPALEGSDEEDGEKVRFYLISLPENGTLYHKGKKVYKIGEEITAPDKLTLDPQNGEQKVVFEYVTADRAGVTSVPAKVEMPFRGLSISGEVFDDGNGDGKINGRKISSVEEKALYVTLLDDKKAVLASRAVDQNGSYLFSGTEGVKPGTKYRLVLGTQFRAISSSLPQKWRYAGEGIAAYDKKKDGQIDVEVGKKSLSSVNFSLNKKPEAHAVKMASQLNPGKKKEIAVPALKGNDLESSDTLQYTVIRLPKNATLFDTGKELKKVPHKLSDPAKLTVDPDDGAQALSFSYIVTDSDGVSSEEATVSMVFNALSLSGHLLNDGILDDNVTGPSISKADNTQIFVLLLSPKQELLSAKAVQSDGSYLFEGKDGVYPQSEYFIALATAGKVDAFGLPEGWSSTGENINSYGPGHDRKADSVIKVKVQEVNIESIDFGINKKPTAEHKESKPQLNPGIDIQVPVPVLSGKDRESGDKLIYTIASLPTLGTLYENGEKIEKAGYVVENESNLTLDPNDSDQIVLFTYTATDEGGAVSDPARVTMPFRGLRISGRIVNDGDGDAKVKGKHIKIPKHMHPYATLLDANGNILATTPLKRDASYSFDGSDGVRPHTNFTVIVSLEANATKPVLPSGWVESGATDDKNVTNEMQSDGRLTVYVDEKNMNNINFGINKKPTAEAKIVQAQINPGGERRVPVPELTGSDRESGKNLRYMIKTLPKNAVLYSQNKEVSVNDIVNPRALSVDPKDGKVDVVFTYATVDPDNIQSDPVDVTMHFTGLSISGSVLEDFMLDGLVDSVSSIADDAVKLYVTLLNKKGEVISSVPMRKNGTYVFSQEMGVNAHTSYTLVLSTEANATSSKLPVGWNHADGENVNSLGKGNDGKADGMIEVQVKESDLKQVDFGVNYLLQ